MAQTTINRCKNDFETLYPILLLKHSKYKLSYVVLENPLKAFSCFLLYIVLEYFKTDRGGYDLLNQVCVLD